MPVQVSQPYFLFSLRIQKVFRKCKKVIEHYKESLKKRKVRKLFVIPFGNVSSEYIDGSSQSVPQ